MVALAAALEVKPEQLLASDATGSALVWAPILAPQQVLTAVKPDAPLRVPTDVDFIPIVHDRESVFGYRLPDVPPKETIAIIDTALLVPSIGARVLVQFTNSPRTRAPEIVDVRQKGGKLTYFDSVGRTFAASRVIILGTVVMTIQRG
jgi:hypothetical protein